MVNFRLCKVSKQQSFSISFISPRHKTLEIYCDAGQHFLMLMRILQKHLDDLKVLQAPAPSERKPPLCLGFGPPYLLTLHSPLPSSATISSPFSPKVLPGPPADVTLAHSRRRA